MNHIRNDFNHKSSEELILFEREENKRNKTNSKPKPILTNLFAASNGSHQLDELLDVVRNLKIDLKVAKIKMNLPKASSLPLIDFRNREHLFCDLLAFDFIPYLKSQKGVLFPQDPRS